MENDISSYTDGYQPFTKSIEVVDDHTIEWTTKQPSLVPGWPGYTLILPSHVWGKLDPKEIEEYKNFPNTVTSSAFKLVEWEPGEFWRLEARDDYYGGTPAIDEVVFRVYQSEEAVAQALIKGEIDATSIATPGLYETVKDKPNVEAVGDQRRGVPPDVVQHRRRSEEHGAPGGARPGRA